MQSAHIYWHDRLVTWYRFIGYKILILIDVVFHVVLLVLQKLGVCCVLTWFCLRVRTSHQ